MSRAPWEERPENLRIHVSQHTKDIEKNIHKNRLQSILKNPHARVFYTDSSQGAQPNQTLTNLSAFVEVYSKSIIGYGSTNVGPYLEVADAEVLAICKALRQIISTPNRPDTSTYYFFIDSQAAISRISKGSTETAKEIWEIAELVPVNIHIY